MQLPAQITAGVEGRNISLSERAQDCCHLAKQLEKAGEYEQACDALGEFWPERHQPPRLDSLDQASQAEVLLRIGALSGWIGSAEQTAGSQETAKNFITRSIELFEALGQSKRAVEAHGDLALCYWREGSFDEARIHLADALQYLEPEQGDLKATLLMRAGIVEVWAQRLGEASDFYNQAAALLELSEDHALKGTFHNERANLFMRLGLGPQRSDYLDRALIDYAAASFHFEQAGHTRYQASVENNLGFLFLMLEKYPEAHEHLNRARNLFLQTGDQVHLAQVNETRARTLLAEGNVAEAERFARQSVRTLERGDEQALLAEALTTLGIAQARLGNYLRAKALLERAIEIAETADDLEGAGRTQLSIIEELGDQTSPSEIMSRYQSAADLLRGSQDPSAAKRLISCARKVISSVGSPPREEQKIAEGSWENFSFKQYVLNCEKEVIERALRDAGGSVTRGARLLGFNHHQSLISLINGRHKELIKQRSAVRKRRRHLFSKSRTSGKN